MPSASQTRVHWEPDHAKVECILRPKKTKDVELISIWVSQFCSVYYSSRNSTCSRCLCPNSPFRTVAVGIWRHRPDLPASPINTTRYSGAMRERVCPVDVLRRRPQKSWEPALTNPYNTTWVGGGQSSATTRRVLRDIRWNRYSALRHLRLRRNFQPVRLRAPRPRHLLRMRQQRSSCTHNGEVMWMWLPTSHRGLTHTQLTRCCESETKEFSTLWYEEKRVFRGLLPEYLRQVANAGHRCSTGRLQNCSSLYPGRPTSLWRSLEHLESTRIRDRIVRLRLQLLSKYQLCPSESSLEGICTGIWGLPRPLSNNEPILSIMLA